MKDYLKKSIKRRSIENSRGSYEHKAIAQVLMEALYLLDSDDTTGMCCFNADEFERGRWGVFTVKIQLRRL